MTLKVPFIAAELGADADPFMLNFYVLAGKVALITGGDSGIGRGGSVWEGQGTGARAAA